MPDELPEPEIANSRRWPIRLGAVVLFVAVVILGSLGRGLEPKTALDLLRSVQERWWAPPAFVLAYIVGTAAMFPAVMFHLVSGAAWGFKQGLVLNLIGLNSSASIHFWIARKLGRARVGRLLERWGLSAGFDRAAEAHGFRAVVAIRILPLPHVAVNLAAGVSAIRWREFALGSLVGTLPMLLVYTYFASSLVDGVAGAREKALWRAGFAAFAVLGVTVLPKAVGWWRRRRKAADAS